MRSYSCPKRQSVSSATPFALAEAAKNKAIVDILRARR